MMELLRRLFLLQRHLLERLLHTQSNQEIHCGQFPRDITAVERSIRKFIMQMQI
nr:MAG TPA: hypothetical protein [Caudoviricetes sp.]